MDTAYVCQRVFDEIKAIPDNVDPGVLVGGIGMRVVLSTAVPDALGFIIQTSDGRLLIPHVELEGDPHEWETHSQKMPERSADE